ncbi:MAG TPA: hypothetical protein VFI22_05125, partial [Thermomicrobiales bacterium]|nr:hypothetical protein [Thermomicrobiales bacterium]
LAGLATGLTSMDALQGDWVKLATELTPQPDAAAVYDHYYPIYRGLYESSKDQVHALARLGGA